MNCVFIWEFLKKRASSTVRNKLITGACIVRCHPDVKQKAVYLPSIKMMRTESNRINYTFTIISASEQYRTAFVEKKGIEPLRMDFQSTALPTELLFHLKRYCVYIRLYVTTLHKTTVWRYDLFNNKYKQKNPIRLNIGL